MSDEMNRLFADTGNGTDIYKKIEDMKRYLDSIESITKEPYRKQQFGYFIQSAKRLLDNPYPSDEKKREVFDKFTMFKGLNSIEGQPDPKQNPKIYEALDKTEKFLEEIGLIEYYSEKDIADKIYNIKARINSLLSEIPRKPECDYRDSMRSYYFTIPIDILTELHNKMNRIEYELLIVFRSFGKRHKCATGDAEHELYMTANNLSKLVSTHSFSINSILIKRCPVDWHDFANHPEKYGC